MAKDSTFNVIRCIKGCGKKTQAFSGICKACQKKESKEAAKGEKIADRRGNGRS